MASPTVAANAYASLARMMEQPGAGKSAEAGSGPSFSSLLKDAVSNVVDAGKKSDAQTVAMASARPAAAVVLASGAGSSTWDQTSLIGKIFIAFGALLTMASAARMFMA